MMVKAAPKPAAAPPEHAAPESNATLTNRAFSLNSPPHSGTGHRFSAQLPATYIGILVVFLSILTVNQAGCGTIFRTNIIDDLQTTDPLSFGGLTTVNVLSQIYEGFIAIAPDGRIVPALATSWQAVDSGLTWRIALRSGVRFHSGREFTADDVRWTFTQLLKPRAQPSLGVVGLRRVVGARDVQEGRSVDLAGVTVVDRYTVEIRLTEPDALFPLMPFFFVDSGIEAEYGADWATRVSAGTGPFKLAGWRHGQEVTLTAHHGYWGGAPSMEAARFAVIPYGETLLALFGSGDLDFAVLPESTARTVLNDPAYADWRLTFSKTQLRYLGLNQALYPPFRDIRVREAVTSALDRDAVVEGLYRGAAARGNGAIPPGLEGYREGNVPVVGRDPERARQLLTDAGYRDGHALPPLEITGTEAVRDELTVYAGQLSAVLGIPVGIRILERGAAIAAANEGKLPFFFSGWTADYPDPLSILLPVWHGASPFNRSRWQNPAFDRLVDQARATPDADSRHALSREAERVLMADRAMIPLPIPKVVALARTGVTGVSILPSGLIDFRGAVVP